MAVWNSLDDKAFLEKLGGYRKDRRTGVEGLTLAGLMMFGAGQAIREKFDNVFMDYRNESEVTSDIRWNDRITYDGTWENNLFNFFTKVTPKLTEDLKKPFKLEGMQRIDETPVHKAVREAFVNLIIHADYLMDAGVLKVIKRSDEFEFTNPGILKLPLEDIYRGGNSKTRNPHMQTMLRLVGFGDNAGSGFPTILDTWKKEGWVKPELMEDTNLNQVTLLLKMVGDVEKQEEIKIAQKNERKMSDKMSDKENDFLEKLIKTLEEDEFVTTNHMSNITGIPVSTVRRYMKKFCELDIINSQGKNKSTKYCLKND